MHRGGRVPAATANVAFVATLGTLVATGIGLTTLHGGPAFVWLVRVHRWATVVLTVLVIAHVLVASGILPGYRGAWRAMHRGGRVPAATADRLWPADSSRPEVEGEGSDRGAAGVDQVDGARDRPGLVGHEVDGRSGHVLRAH
jgi:hypothetical protein